MQNVIKIQPGIFTVVAFQKLEDSPLQVKSYDTTDTTVYG